MTDTQLATSGKETSDEKLQKSGSNPCRTTTFRMAMNRFLALLIVTFASFHIGAFGKNTNTLVWCGLDYSLVKLIGTRDFRRPETIFPGMLNEWNSLFMEEVFPKLESLTTSVSTDMRSVRANNEKANASQIIREDGSKAEMVDASAITSAGISNVIAAYEIKYQHGIGAVFVMDRLIKAQETECLYVVFFDISSRKVLSSTRIVEKAGGFSFRNYWFSPVKKAAAEVPKLYKKALKIQAAK